MDIDRNSYIEKILPFSQKPVIKVITGMRRSGKSSILRLLQKKILKNNPSAKILYINKESLEFDSLNDYNKLNHYVTKRFSKKSKNQFLFIDEVQEIQSWEKAVASFLATGIADIFISGSNANMLSSELATLLSGRYIEFPVYSLTFKEFLNFRGKNSASRESEFNQFIKFGGLPGIHYLPFEEDVMYQYINSIFNTILLKDIIQRNAIRNSGLLERITGFVIDNCGSLITSKRISDYFKSQKISISVDTVLNYLSFLSSGFLVHRVSRYDLKGKKHLELYDKYYIGDVGLRHSFLGYKDSDISGILENIVYLELRKRGYKVSIGKLDNLEIDFIAEKDHEVKYFQVAYLLKNNKTSDREFIPLEKIDDNFPKYVLSMDSITRTRANGIIHKNIIDFLLE